MVRLSWGLHVRTAPRLGHGGGVVGVDLSAVCLVTLIADQHDGDGLNVALDGDNLLHDGLELLQGLPAADAVDQDEGMAFADGQALHGGKLMAACGVGDLERAHLFVAADHLWTQRQASLTQALISTYSDNGAVTNEAGSSL